MFVGEIVTHDIQKITDAANANAKTTITGVFNVQGYGALADGKTDNTSAYNALIADAPDGSKVVFPTGTYVGNFESTKAFEIDGMGSTLIPSDDTKATIKFYGTIGDALTVTGNPDYGDLTFDVDDASDLSEDDIGYLVDEAVATDDEEELNKELIKIKSISTNTITVYDMIRSMQNTGTVSFHKVTTLKNPQVRNLKIPVSDTNTGAAIWYYGCENPITENVEVSNNTGHAVRHDYCYNWRTQSVRVLKPYSVGSGEGYGITASYCRHGIARDTYGNGTRHLIDFDAAYCSNVENVVEENGQSATVIISHNGYGDSIYVNNVKATADNYAVKWGSTIASPDGQTARNCRITNIQHIIPTATTDEHMVTVYFTIDYADLVIDNVHARYIDTSATPATTSQVVRLAGNCRGSCRLTNISANEVGSLVWADARSTYGAGAYNFIVNNVSATTVNIAVVLRGIIAASIDNVYVDSALTSLYKLDTYGEGAGNTPTYMYFGDNVVPTTDTVLTYTGLPAVGLMGRWPQTNIDGQTGLFLEDGGKITENQILNSGGFLRLIPPAEADITLDATTPIDPPLWRGQKFTAVVTSLGYTGTRGTITIPTGSNTYADGGSSYTMAKGKVYRFVGYNGLWRIYDD